MTNEQLFYLSDNKAHTMNATRMPTFSDPSGQLGVEMSQDICKQTASILFHSKKTGGTADNSAVHSIRV